MTGQRDFLGLRVSLAFWGGVLALTLLLLWVFSSVLLPFTVGAAVAYLLDPVVERLGRAGVSRRAAALLMLGSFFGVVAALAALVVPLLVHEVALLAHHFPEYVQRGRALIEPWIARVQVQMGGGDGAPPDLMQAVQDHIGQAAGVGAGIAAGLVSGSQAVVSLATVLALTPIVAYFLMKEWPLITRWVDDLMPREHAPTLRGLVREIDRKISGFVRGQLTVCAVLGAIYAVALVIAGLKYGFLIGLASGVLSIIPMVGSTVGLLTGVAVAWFQSGGEWGYVGLIAGIFVLGNIIEGNVLTPKLVGDSVGLHPLWVIFALMAGGALFGLLGMFLAVPVAAVIGVLVSFALTLYRRSAFYGEGSAPQDAADRSDTP